MINCGNSKCNNNLHSTCKINNTDCPYGNEISQEYNCSTCKENPLECGFNTDMIDNEHCPGFVIQK